MSQRFSNPGKQAPITVNGLRYLCALVLSLCMVFGVTGVNAQTKFPYCQSASADQDGDGWGWENNLSCVVQGSQPDVKHNGGDAKPATSSSSSNAGKIPSSVPACTGSNSDPDGDGYGWENNKTCVVRGGEKTSNQAGSSSSSSRGNSIPSWVPSCTQPNSDPDGDGYGWENNKTCAARGVQSTSNQSGSSLANCRSAISDSDRDGFGFENGKSCIVKICSSSNSDPDGDGFGWENNQTCATRSVQSTSNQSGSSLASCRSVSSDPDKDGFGFENGKTCIVKICSTTSSDPDGDGFGWENGSTCAARSERSSASSFSNCRSVSSDPDKDGFGFENGKTCIVKICASANSDPDGDGFGWENNQTCAATSVRSPNNQTVSSMASCRSVSSDPDKDGFGFENGKTCIVKICSGSNSDPDGDGFGWENGSTCAATARTSAGGNSKGPTSNQGGLSVNDITDVVLVTGQSNVLASNTTYDKTLDAPERRVFAYTDKGWQMADLHQTWDRFMHPGHQSLNNSGKQPTNSFALHFGKRLTQRDASRVVAFIVVPGPGKGISNWDQGTAQYNRITQKVTRALADIPHKNSIDAVLWHQGENDWMYEGTADANPTGFTSEDSYEYRNYYQIKLDALISNFRNESWGRSDTAFICGETRRAKGVNKRLMALNNDNDPLTACVKATDLPQRADDKYGSHFSAAGLRTLGKRYADALLKMNR